MHRILAVLIAGILSAGFTVGELEPGPNVPVTLPSGATATFETWVNVDDSREFEATWMVDALTKSDAEFEAILNSARLSLQPWIRSARADSILLHVMTEGPQEISAFTCSYANLKSVARCFRH